MKIEKFNAFEYEVTFTDIDDYPTPDPKPKEQQVREMLTGSLATAMGFHLHPTLKIDTVVQKNNSKSWIVTCKKMR